MHSCARMAARPQEWDVGGQGHALPTALEAAYAARGGATAFCKGIERLPGTPPGHGPAPQARLGKVSDTAHECVRYDRWHLRRGLRTGSISRVSRNSALIATCYRYGYSGRTGRAGDLYDDRNRVSSR